jgi:hypothetical protein
MQAQFTMQPTKKIKLKIHGIFEKLKRRENKFSKLFIRARNMQGQQILSYRPNIFFFQLNLVSKP